MTAHLAINRDPLPMQSHLHPEGLPTVDSDGISIQAYINQTTLGRQAQANRPPSMK